MEFEYLNNNSTVLDIINNINNISTQYINFIRCYIAEYYSKEKKDLINKIFRTDLKKLVLYIRYYFFPEMNEVQLDFNNLGLHDFIFNLDIVPEMRPDMLLYYNLTFKGLIYNIKIAINKMLNPNIRKEDQVKIYNYDFCIYISTLIEFFN